MKLFNRLFSLTLILLNTGLWAATQAQAENHHYQQNQTAQQDQNQENNGSSSSACPTSSKSIPTDQPTVLRGEQLFADHCSECHFMCRQRIGPALASATDRRPLPWLISFIRNSQEVIQTGDEYANFLYEQYNNAVMPAFEFLQPEEIVSILSYIKYMSAAEVAEAGANSNLNETGDARFQAPPEDLRQTNSNDDGGNNNTFLRIIFGITIIVTVVVLVGAIVWAAKRMRR